MKSTEKLWWDRVCLYICPIDLLLKCQNSIRLHANLQRESPPPPPATHIHTCMLTYTQPQHTGTAPRSDNMWYYRSWHGSFIITLDGYFIRFGGHIFKLTSTRHIFDEIKWTGRRTFLRIVARILPRSSSRSVAFRCVGSLCECICSCLFCIVVYLFAHIHQLQMKRLCNV